MQLIYDLIFKVAQEHNWGEIHILEVDSDSA